MRGIQILKFPTLVVFISLLPGCEKIFMEENPSPDPQSCFDNMWNTVDRKYSYFIEKDINWDSIYTYYDRLISPQSTNQELFQVLDSMLYDLRDGHVNLIAPFDFSRNWNWYLDYPENFSFSVIERNYLADDYRIAGGIRYRLIDSVGYIYYGSFSSGFTQENLDEVFRYLAPAKGVIMDVRNNGGGSLGRAFSLAQRFSPDNRTVLLTREKTGPAHSDFGRETQYGLRPGSRPRCTVPVVLLTNRKCYSATNTFAGILSQYPQVTLIGDQTGGGGGIPVDFELPNGWRYRFSASQSFIFLNGEPFEIEEGVYPDIKLDLDPQNLQNGVDDLLETALNYLR
jgi:hypothetical protein